MHDFNPYSGVIYDWGLFRYDVRRDVRNCVLFLFFFYGVNLLVTLIVEIIWLVSDPAPWGMMSGGLPAMDSQEIMLGLSSILGIVAGGCVFLICRGRRFFTDLARPAKEPMTPKIFILLVVVTQGIQYGYGLLTTLIDMLLSDGLSLTESYGDAIESLVTPFGLIYIVFVGPIFEELIFRGAVMGSLRRFGDNFAILFSSLLFGFYHMVILQIPFGFVMGLLFGYVAARWSLRASVALHIIVNGLSMLLTMNAENTFLITAGGLAMIACGILTLIFAIAWRKRLGARIRRGAAYYPHTYANGFSSIAFWIFLAVMTAVGVIQMVFSEFFSLS